MTQTEWIISLDDDLKDYDELFVGNVRDGDRLTRCRDCKYYQTKGRNADDWQWCMMNHHYTDEEKYCAWAKRAEE